ncbi:MAG TPA: hypothetical protein VJI66_02685 [Candidatus Paceibacterota bacterium]
MKMKQLFAVIECLLLSFVSTFAAVTVDDTVTFDTPITLAERAEMYQKNGWALHRQALPFVAGHLEGVQIFSLCASTSPSLIESRKNTMAWMVGVPGVPTNRTLNPAACYSIPANGLQWFDWLTTGYKSWLGTTATVMTNENGHRIVISCAGLAPVSKYNCRVSSTSTNIGNADFPVGLFTGSTNEIPFNLNFVGVNPGPNGTSESFYDYTLGRWVQAGDDSVYINGEYPSSVSNYWWYRFGATLSKSVSLPGDAESVKAEFTAKTNTLTAELVIPSVSTNSIGSITVTQVLPKLAIESTATASRLTVVEGQPGLKYGLLMATNMPASGWTRQYSNESFEVGASFDSPIPGLQGYFRLIGVNPGQ